MRRGTDNFKNTKNKPPGRAYFLENYKYYLYKKLKGYDLYG